MTNPTAKGLNLPDRCLTSKNTGQSLQPRTGIESGVSEFSKFSLPVAIVLVKNKIPDLDAINVYFCIWSTWAFVTGRSPEIIRPTFAPNIGYPKRVPDALRFRIGWRGSVAAKNSNKNSIFLNAQHFSHKTPRFSNRLFLED